MKSNYQVTSSSRSLTNILPVFAKLEDVASAFIECCGHKGAVAGKQLTACNRNRKPQACTVHTHLAGSLGFLELSPLIAMSRMLMSGIQQNRGNSPAYMYVLSSSGSELWEIVTLEERHAAGATCIICMQATQNQVSVSVLRYGSLSGSLVHWARHTSLTARWNMSEAKA